MTRRQARVERHEERIRRKREELAPAAVALIRAQEWQTLMDDEGINRAEIARRHGLSRARVTQVMSLMNLDIGLRTDLVSRNPSCAGMTVRRALVLAATTPGAQ
jgi:ParB-like chromosome segregation protein Spo0J